MNKDSICKIIDNSKNVVNELKDTYKETMKVINENINKINEEKFNKAKEYHNLHLDLESKTTRYVNLNRGQIFELRTDVIDLDGLLINFINSITIDGERFTDFDGIKNIIDLLTINEVNKLNDFIDEIYNY